MRRYLGALLFGTVLIAPVVVRADDDDHHHANRVQRYYDRDAHDYHEWNEHEQQAYRRWWAEQHRENEMREWNRLNRKRQQDYWRWRHEHPDVR